MPALFISDLHLAETRPAIARLFFEFLDAKVKGQAEELYILGDLFEYWIGDEDLDLPFNRSIALALRSVADSGTRVGVMHGNRDFLLGPRFSDSTGASMLPDVLPIDLFGTPTLLLHGDTLCTDDHAYQQFRRIVRDAQWQQNFLKLPVAARRQQAQAVRSRSESDKQTKSEQIMDVNPGAVEGLFRTGGYPRMIHGHTHRPARHEHQVDGTVCERWVLQDWYESGAYLECDNAGCRVFPLTSQ